MFNKYRSTGNWAEDLGNGIHFLLMLGLAAVITIPILLVVIVVLCFKAF